MPRRLYKIILLSLLAFPIGAQAKKDKSANPDYGPSLPIAPPPASANGAIFQIGHYSPLTSGARAARVGDIITINLVERTSASKSTSATTGRNGSLGLSPPLSGPLNLISAGDVNMSGDQSFTGKGETAQSNALSGELSVTVAAVYPNGNMLVQGEKALTLNRGDEKVQFTGIVRSADISVDNRVLSTRVAAARIVYTGKGEIARASQQGWLQRFFTRVSPF
ncbi:flagellar basal body L-ring protein FlgH [Sphingorhabdus sp.]|jgi:flagellar L-ring protein precursor FlgH|uniref:flagellar basal body L-ring protein FlgH n=1 Tax=Sphingorhabdus sp. TaxID=1902408 RepID=UPI0037CC3614